jgi:hypothetical protein
MGSGVEAFERSVLFRVVRIVGIIASIIGLLMVIGGGFAITRVVSMQLASRRVPSVSTDEVRDTMHETNDDEKAGSAIVVKQSEVTPGCEPSQIDPVAASIAEELPAPPDTDWQTQRVAKTEQTQRVAKLMREQCEDLDESCRAAFFENGETVIRSAPKGKRAEYWDAYTKLFDKKLEKLRARRAEASSETLMSTMVAGGLTLGGFVIVALFGALLALLAIERLTRARVAQGVPAR